MNTKNVTFGRSFVQRAAALFALTAPAMLGVVAAVAPVRSAQAQGLFGIELSHHRYANRTGQNVGVNGTPVGIGDLRWGMSHKDIEKIYKDSGMTTMDVPDHMLSYVIPFSWPGAKYKYVMQVWLIDDQLESILVGVQDEKDQTSFWGRTDAKEAAAEMMAYLEKTWPNIGTDKSVTQTLDSVTLYQTKKEFAGVADGITGYNKVFDHWEPPMMMPMPDGSMEPEGAGQDIYRDEPVYGKVNTYKTVVTKQWKVPFGFTVNDAQWTPTVKGKSNGVVYRFATLIGDNIGIVRFRASRDNGVWWNRGLTEADMTIADKDVRDNVFKNYCASPTDVWAKTTK